MVFARANAQLFRLFLFFSAGR